MLRLSENMTTAQREGRVKCVLNDVRMYFDK
jgi:hypothetical protein